MAYMVSYFLIWDKMGGDVGGKNYDLLNARKEYKHRIFYNPVKKRWHGIKWKETKYLVGS